MNPIEYANVFNSAKNSLLTSGNGKGPNSEYGFEVFDNGDNLVTERDDQTDGESSEEEEFFKEKVSYTETVQDEDLTAYVKNTTHLDSSKIINNIYHKYYYIIASDSRTAFAIFVCLPPKTYDKLITLKESNALGNEAKLFFGEDWEKEYTPSIYEISQQTGLGSHIEDLTFEPLYKYTCLYDTNCFWVKIPIFKATSFMELKMVFFTITGLNPLFLHVETFTPEVGWESEINFVSDETNSILNINMFTEEGREDAQNTNPSQTIQMVHSINPNSHHFVVCHMDDYSNLYENKNFFQHVLPFYPQFSQHDFETNLNLEENQKMTSNMFESNWDTVNEMQIRQQQFIGEMIDTKYTVKVAEIPKLIEFRFINDLTTKVYTIYSEVCNKRAYVEYYYTKNGALNCYKLNGLPKNTVTVRDAIMKNTPHAEKMLCIFVESWCICYLYVDINSNVKIFVMTQNGNKTLEELIDATESLIYKNTNQKLCGPNTLMAKDITKLQLEYKTNKLVTQSVFDSVKGHLFDKSADYVYDIQITSSNSFTLVLLILPKMRMGGEILKDIKNEFLLWTTPQQVKTGFKQQFPANKPISLTVTSEYYSLKINTNNTNIQNNDVLELISIYILQKIEDVPYTKEQETEIANIQKNSKALANVDANTFNSKNGGRNAQGKMNFSQRCQAQNQPKIVTKQMYETFDDDQKSRTYSLVNKTSGEDYLLMCAQAHPYLVWLVQVDINTVTINGEEFYRCVPCCRKKNTQSRPRILQNKYCSQNGYFPKKNFKNPTRVVFVLTFRQSTVEERIMYFPSDVQSMLPSPNKFFLLGMPQCKYKELNIVQCIAKAVETTLSEFFEKISTYYIKNDTDYNKLMTMFNLYTDIEPEKIFEEDMLINGSFFENDERAEKFFKIIVRDVWDLSLYVLSKENKYNLTDFIYPSRDLCIMLFKYGGGYFPILQVPEQKMTVVFEEQTFVFPSKNPLTTNVFIILSQINQQMKSEETEFLKLLSSKYNVIEQYAHGICGIYGVKIKLDGDEFYFPCQNTQALDCPVTYEEPKTFPFTKVALDILSTTKTVPINICSDENVLWGFNTIHGFVYVKETNLLVRQKDKDSIIYTPKIQEIWKIPKMPHKDYKYDYRNLSTIWQREDTENDKYQKRTLELAKSLMYPNYMLMFLTNYKDIPKSKTHRYFMDSLKNIKEKNLKTFVMNDVNFSQQTKHSIIRQLNSNIKTRDIVFIEDIVLLQKKDMAELKKDIIKTMEKIIKITDDEKDLLGVCDFNFVTDKPLYLNKDFAENFPQILAKDLVTPNRGNIYAAQLNTLQVLNYGQINPSSVLTKFTPANNTNRSPIL